MTGIIFEEDCLLYVIVENMGAEALRQHSNGSSGHLTQGAKIALGHDPGATAKPVRQRDYSPQVDLQPPIPGSPLRGRIDLSSVSQSRQPKAAGSRPTPSSECVPNPFDRARCSQDDTADVEPRAGPLDVGPPRIIPRGATERFALLRIYRRFRRTESESVTENLEAWQASGAEVARIRSA